MNSFNLTREAWIPVEALDGRVSEVSTREALRRAHELRALADPSPLVTAALTRHLLAVLHRSYDGPRSMEQWVGIAAAGTFDPDRVEAYLDRVEDRMDLFHPTHPFAQTPRLLERFGAYVRPIDQLDILRSSWGTARDLFQHRPLSPRPRWSPARAARGLLAHHAFALEGTVKKPGEPDSASAGPLVRGAVVIVRGDTLFRTLVSNLLRYNSEQPIPTGGGVDACSWEQEPPPTVLSPGIEPKRQLFGYLDLLTWLSRRVQLDFDRTAVTGFVNAIGKGIQAGASLDPMMCFRKDKKLGWRPLGIDAKRAFWRESAALFESARAGSATFSRPLALGLVASYDAPEFISNAMYDVEVMGVSSARAPLDAVRIERIQAHGRCFNDPDAGTAVREALDFAHRAEKSLNDAISKYAEAALSPGERHPDKKDVAALNDSFGARPATWSALGVAFEQLLGRLDQDPDGALTGFCMQATSVVKAVFDSVTSRSEKTGRWLKARALAEKSFSARIAALAASHALPTNEGVP